MGADHNALIYDPESYTQSFSDTYTLYDIPQSHLNIAGRTECTDLIQCQNTILS